MIFDKFPFVPVFVSAYMEFSYTVLEVQQWFVWI